MNLKGFKGITAESIFFYSCLAATLVILIFLGSFPTLDGPSHTYNAKIADYLLSGNKFISTYYSLSTRPSPNYTDQYLLAFFCKFLSFASAGKLMEIIYVISFPVLFRRLVWRFNPGGIGMSILSIPFAFNMLFFLGFYNFCLSFSLIFAIILYYHKWFYNKPEVASLSRYLMLMLLAVLLYFTNGLAFLFAGLILGMFELYTLFPVIFKRVPITEKFLLLKHISLFIAVWIPGLILFWFFMSQTPAYTTSEQHSFSELLQWLKEVRVMVVFTGNEVDYTQWMFYVLLLALVSALITRYKAGELFKFKGQGIFFIAFICALVMYFVVPDGLSVGMMSIRFCVYVFMFFILWLAMQPNFKIVTWLVAVTCMYIHFMLFINVHIPAENDLENQSEIVKAASDFIEPNSIVLDVNLSDNWLYSHMGDYLAATGKPLVIVPNYEADDCWFATVWNADMPQIIYNEQDSIPGFCNLPGDPNAPLVKEIDYVFLHGDYNKLMNAPKFSGIREGILKKYNMFYSSPDSSICVYELKVKSTLPEPNHLQGQSTTPDRAL